MMKTLACLVATALCCPFVEGKEAKDDPFGVRMKWSGVRKMEKNNGKLRPGLLMVLTITERKDKEFKGTLVLNMDASGKNKFEVGVTGTGPAEGDGDVNFKSERKGSFEQTFRGKLVNGAISLDFRGKNSADESVDGVVNLLPKN